MRWLASALVAAALPVGSGAASPVCTPRAAAAPVGLTAGPTKQLTPRAAGLSFTSRAMNGTVHAVVLLPVGYVASPTRRYPVLYLLHGHGGGAMDWTRHDVESVIGAAPVIVVMPDGGYDGFYADWYGTDLDGHTPTPAPAWETFHIRELLPWIDADYRTLPGRAGRAVAGNSMGGFGALSYAARHPDLFVAAGGFSGAVDPLLLWPVGATAYALVPNLPDQKPSDLCIWGDPVTQQVRWADADPTNLAANFGSTAVYLRTGDGSPGRYDDIAAKQPSPGAVLNEFGIQLMNDNLHAALNRVGVAHTAVFEHGVHDWPYWLSDLRQFLPIARAAFNDPPAAPPAVAFSYTTGRSTLSVWDWTFRSDRPDQTSMLTAEDVGRDGLRVIGRGRVRVDTARLFTPGAGYRVNGRHHTADASGRLHFTVAATRHGTAVDIVSEHRSGGHSPG